MNISMIRLNFQFTLYSFKTDFHFISSFYLIKALSKNIPFLEFLFTSTLMLKQNNQKNPKQRKLHEAALKHKVRNLRAKVQTLLPIHFCEKIFKRNNRMNNRLLRRHLLSIEQSHQEVRSSTNSLSQAQVPWKYTSGYNIKKHRPVHQGPMSRTTYIHQSQKTSFHASPCECNQDEELFFDDEFLSIGKESVSGKGKSKKQAMMNGYHFQKLTDNEIEQIEEDKLYYLGQQKHIEAYQKFIREKNTQKTTIPISNQVYKSVSKSTIAFGTTKNIQNNMKFQTNTSLESQNTNKYLSYKIKDKSSRKTSSRMNIKRRDNNSIMQSKNTIHNGAELRVFRNTTNQRPMWNVNENLARINEEQQIKRILLSMELKSKQSRVEENFKKIMNTRIQIIEQENLKDHFKILSAQEKKRKICNQVGEIVDLTEKLRKKCIQRKSIIGKQNLNAEAKNLNTEN